MFPAALRSRKTEPKRHNECCGGTGPTFAPQDPPAHAALPHNEAAQPQHPAPGQPPHAPPQQPAHWLLPPAPPPPQHLLLHQWQPPSPTMTCPHASPVRDLSPGGSVPPRAMWNQNSRPPQWVDSEPGSPIAQLVGLSDLSPVRNEFPPRVLVAYDGRGYYPTDGRPESYYERGGSYYERIRLGIL